MMALKKEKFKTLLLLLLVITSFLQIGIHWYQQAQGFPFRFIEGIFNINDDEFPSMEVDSLKHRYFIPEAIIVSVSPTSSLWKLEKNDPYFISIWNDVRRNYFPIMIKEKPTNIIPKDQWPSIISKRCIRIDFAANLPKDVIFWLRDMSNREFKGFSSVSAIAIVPQTDVNQTVNTVFVYDKNQVYEYQINLKEDFLPKVFYSDLADELSIKYKAVNYLTAITAIFESQEDILVSIDRGSGKAYSTLIIDIPSSIRLNRTNMENDSIQDNILLNQKVSLMGTYDEPKGKVSFTDTQNLYTLSEDGVLEYHYLRSVNKDSGMASGALSQALSFIELRRNLLGDAALVLTEIEKIDHYYLMHFEYEFNGVPVYYTGIDSKSKIGVPLVIKANSERVLEAYWVIRSFHETDEYNRYSLYFNNLVETQIRTFYPELLGNEPKRLQRLSTGYVFGLESQDDLAKKPQWIISTDLSDYFIPLLAEEG